jgi:hypothetical protein
MDGIELGSGNDERERARWGRKSWDETEIARMDAAEIWDEGMGEES